MASWSKQILKIFEGLAASSLSLLNIELALTVWVLPNPPPSLLVFSDFLRYLKNERLES
jgi:hypothetical protein